MQQVTVKDGVKPVTVDVHFDPNVTNARIIATVAKRALEKEATDNAVIKVVFEKRATGVGYCWAAPKFAVGVLTSFFPVN